MYCLSVEFALPIDDFYSLVNDCLGRDQIPETHLILWWVRIWRQTQIVRRNHHQWTWALSFALRRTRPGKGSQSEAPSKARLYLTLRWTPTLPHADAVFHLLSKTGGESSGERSCPSVHRWPSLASSRGYRTSSWDCDWKCILWGASISATLFALRSTIPLQQKQIDERAFSASPETIILLYVNARHQNPRWYTSRRTWCVQHQIFNSKSLSHSMSVTSEAKGKLCPVENRNTGSSSPHSVDNLCDLFEGPSKTTSLSPEQFLEPSRANWMNMRTTICDARP